VAYGLRAMVDLALREGRSPVQSRDIATSQDIPEPYLNQLLSALRKGGLIMSRRGPGGGHYLARPATSITLNDIVCALDGPVGLEIGEEATGSAGTTCSIALGVIWRELGGQVRQTLTSVTLADLATRVRERSLTYQI
jgi:Rrf2 family protein